MPHDISMDKVREAFKDSGLSLDTLGRKMGYSGETARKSAWQFLNKTADPRISMLRKFAAALDIPIADLVAGRRATDKGRESKA